MQTDAKPLRGLARRIRNAAVVAAVISPGEFDIEGSRVTWKAFPRWRVEQPIAEDHIPLLAPALVFHATSACSGRKSASANASSRMAWTRSSPSARTRHAPRAQQVTFGVLCHAQRLRRLGRDVLLDHRAHDGAQRAGRESVKLDTISDGSVGVPIAVALGRARRQVVLFDLLLGERDPLDIWRLAVEVLTYFIEPALDGLRNQHAGWIVVPELVDVAGLAALLGSPNGQGAAVQEGERRHAPRDHQRHVITPDRAARQRQNTQQRLNCHSWRLIQIMSTLDM